MFICLHLSPTMSENLLDSPVLHAVSMPYDDDMVNMHVCISALSQITLYCAVCMLCNGIIIVIIQPQAFRKVMILFVHHLSVRTPSVAANPFLLSAFIELCAMSKANLL